MKKNFGEYQRAAGRGRYEGSLWFGAEHLLVIENSGFIFPFSESYRRIDYRNIQALTIAKTKRGAILTAFLLAALALLGWGIYKNFEEDRGISFFFSFLAVPLLIALIVHWVRGPTSICRLQTAVQILTLRPLNRLKTAQQFITRIEPLCGGQLTAESSFAESLTGTVKTNTLPFGVKIKSPWMGSRLVKWTLVLLLLGNLVSAGELFVKGMPYYFIDMLLTVASIGLVCASAAEISRYQTPSALRWSVWGNAVLMVAGIILGYGLMFYTMIKSSVDAVRSAKRAGASEFNMWLEMANADINTYGVFSWVWIGMNVFGFLLALIGLPTARAGAELSTPSQPPAIPPPLSPP